MYISIFIISFMIFVFIIAMDMWLRINSKRITRIERYLNSQFGDFKESEEGDKYKE